MALCEINMNQNVKTVAQTLTTEQQEQARTNIGAGDAATLATLGTLVEETFADMFLIRVYTYTFTLAASSTKNIYASDFGITEIEGYSRIGVVGFSTGYSVLQAYRVVADAPIDGSVAADSVMAVRNTSTSQQADRTARIKILFVKTALFEAAASTETT